ncbi:4912_t:CDS:2, partial [Funneliformis geosporum]
YLPNIDGSSLTMENFQRYWQHKKNSDQNNVQKISISSCINPCKLHNGISMGILILIYCPVHIIRMKGKDFCENTFKLYNSSESQTVSATGSLAFFMTLAQSINLILCHRNFRNNLGFYLKYEDIPPEYEYNDDDLMKRNKFI